MTMKLSAVISLTLVTLVTARYRCDRDEYLCDDGQCVSRWWTLCSYGYAVCDDKSDLKTCTENIECRQSYGDYNKTTLESPTNHSECQYKLKENTGVYDNIGRGDEKDLTTLVQSSTVNYTELQHCTTKYDNPGFMCEEGCVVARWWCWDNLLSFSCSTILPTGNK